MLHPRLMSVCVFVLGIPAVLCANIMTIAEIKEATRNGTLPLGSEVTIAEAVISNSTNLILDGDGRSNSEMFQIKDHTGSVSIFLNQHSAFPNNRVDFLNGAVAGDVISFTARTHSHFGLLQLTDPVSPITLVTEKEYTHDLDPVEAMISDFFDYSDAAEALESAYVKFLNVRLLYGGTYYTGSVDPYDDLEPASGMWEYHTTYVAEDMAGNRVLVWSRSQESVDTLNAFYGGIPEGYYDLTGIAYQAFDSNDPLPCVAGEHYILIPVSVPEPASVSILALGAFGLLKRK